MLNKIIKTPQVSASTNLQRKIPASRPPVEEERRDYIVLYYI